MIGAILTDIEGTTSSLSFVKDVLFPYAHKHLPEFVREHATDARVAEQLAAVNAEVGSELELEQAINQLLLWIEEDRKITPLKTLQGMIWEAGYLAGAFTGHVYADAVQQLRAWHEQGIALYVFSSGSVQAQKLLFGFTEYGDLTPLFSGYFDTTMGSKREEAAYQAIAAAIGLPASSILFLSDIKEELDAARICGMRTTWLVRDGSMPQGAAHPVASNFRDITF